MNPGHPRDRQEYSTLYYNHFMELGSKADVFFDSASASERRGYREARSLGTWVVALGMLQNSSPKYYVVAGFDTRSSERQAGILFRSFGHSPWDVPKQ